MLSLLVLCSCQGENFRTPGKLTILQRCLLSLVWATIGGKPSLRSLCFVSPLETSTCRRGRQSAGRGSGGSEAQWYVQQRVIRSEFARMARSFELRLKITTHTIQRPNYLLEDLPPPTHTRGALCGSPSPQALGGRAQISNTQAWLQGAQSMQLLGSKAPKWHPGP